jgi:hypothetical protein
MVPSSFLSGQPGFGEHVVNHVNKGIDARGCAACDESRKSGHTCASCSEAIDFDEEAMLLQGAFPYFDGQTIFYNMALDDEGEPEVMPLFMHASCWEMVCETMLEICEDEPPDEEPEAIITCDMCDSSMRMGEKVVNVDTGQVKKSERLGGPRFHKYEDVENFVICLPCALAIADIIEAETWTEVSQQGECYGCTKAKCWRAGRCMCHCHNS